MLEPHMKKLAFLMGEIHTHGTRLDIARAAYWIGVTIALGFSVPDNVAQPMISGSRP